MSSLVTVAGRMLSGAGASAAGPLLPLRAPLNLWSGLDPARGVIVDRGHPDRGTAVTATVLVIPALSGATGGASLAESLRRGTGPAGIVVTAADPAVVLAVAVARELYGVHCPIIEIDAGQIPLLRPGTFCRMERDGHIEVSAAVESQLRPSCTGVDEAP